MNGGGTPPASFLSGAVPLTGAALLYTEGNSTELYCTPLGIILYCTPLGILLSSTVPRWEFR